MQMKISEIKINPGRRDTQPKNVEELARSIAAVGLMNPITVTQDNTLIAGLHRLEAAKLLGWTEIECVVSEADGLQAELAEIDENFVRAGLSHRELGDLLLRRKELYEAIHPETRQGQRNGQTAKNANFSLLETKSFSQDTAEKLGVVPRTVEGQIQTAKNLTQEAKEIIKNADKKISKKEALKLSRLEPEDQKEAARLLTTQQIRNMGEYAEKKKEEPEKAGDSLKDMIAELKDPDKDCSGTPDSFLEEYGAFVRKFHKEIGWYSDPYYDTVFPFVSPEQLSILRELTDSICAAAGQLLHKVERTMKT